MKLLPKSRSAFTLVELLVVVFIITILVTIATSSFNQAQKIGRDGKRAADLQLMATALELYYQDHGFYPNSKSLFQTAGLYEEDVINCLLGEPTFIVITPTDGSWTCMNDWTAGGPSGIVILGPYKAYLPKLPKDPKTDAYYAYASDGQMFTLSTLSYEGTPPSDHAFTNTVLFYSQAVSWNGAKDWSKEYVVNSKDN